jgi:uroporphyrinogen decarboxylase
MTSRERLLCVLAGEVPDRVPYYEAGIDYPWICKLLDRQLPSKENFDSGEYRTNDIDDQLRLNEILHRDNLSYAALPPIPAHKLPGEDQILFFHDGKIKTWADLEAFEMPDVNTPEFAQPLRDFVKVCREHDYAAVAMSRCGISATYLAMGFEHFFLTLIDDPDLVEALMKRYAEWAAELVPVLADAGFDMVHTADDVAGKAGPLISPQMYRDRFWKHVHKVGDAIRATDIKWVFHSDGQLSEVLEDMLDLGIHVLNPIEPACMDIGQLKQEIGHRVVLSGNTDVDLLSQATPDEVERYVVQMLGKAAPGGGYFMSSGNSVASYTTVENVRRMCDTNFKYGGYPLRLPEG